MRWSYKTIHYELKKEGLLGSAFLDESEIELSLNQYGKAGWELVSLLETMDGLIAVFKQPLDLDTRFAVPPPAAKPKEKQDPEKTVQQARVAKVEKIEEEEYDLELTDATTDEAVILDEFEIVEDEAVQSEETARKAFEKIIDEDSSPPADVGSIKIE